MYILNEKAFHKSISTTLLEIHRKEKIGLDHILAINLFWKVIIIKNLVPSEIDLNSFLQNLINRCQTIRSKTNFSESKLDKEFRRYFDEKQKVYTTVFGTIWENKIYVALFHQWETECEKIFKHAPFSESNCLKYLLMQNEHFGLTNENLILSLEFINKMYDEYRNNSLKNSTRKMHERKQTK